MVSERSAPSKMAFEAPDEIYKPEGYYDQKEIVAEKRRKRRGLSNDCSIMQ